MSEPVSTLASAAADLETVESEIESVGESRVRAVAEGYDDAIDLLDRYEESATGTGDFAAYVEFQNAFVALTESLDEDVPHRDAFVETNDLMDQRRLSEHDFDRARELLEPAEETAALLDRRETARERYREARRDVTRRLDEVETRIDDLERLQSLGEADIDAPVERLRDPIESYNDAAGESFRTFKAEASAREVLSVVAVTDAYPLVPFQSPPSDLQSYVDAHPPGTEPIPQLLDYAEYSASKLDHYVDDPKAFRTAVGVNRTYLERLGPDPLTVSWPPPKASTLRYRARELVAVLGRFAPEDVVESARGLRDLGSMDGDEYDRLRDAARARHELTDAERERLADGGVADDLAAARDDRERLREALAEYPER